MERTRMRSVGMLTPVNPTTSVKIIHHKVSAYSASSCSPTRILTLQRASRPFLHLFSSLLPAASLVIIVISVAWAAACVWCRHSPSAPPNHSRILTRSHSLKTYRIVLHLSLPCAHHLEHICNLSRTSFYKARTPCISSRTCYAP